MNIKNLALLLILVLPSLSFSQMILERVTKTCYSDKSRNFNDCTAVTSNMSIFIENDYLTIKTDIETTKYEIDSYYEENGKRLDTFDVIIDGEIHTATIVEDKIAKVFFIWDKDKIKQSVFYFYK